MVAGVIKVLRWGCRIICFMCLWQIAQVESQSDDKIFQKLQDVLQLANAEDWTASLALIDSIYQQHPNDGEVNQLYGTILVKMEDQTHKARSLFHFQKAFSVLGYGNPGFAANYLEVLRLNGKATEALSIAEELKQHVEYQPSPSTTLFYYNLAVLEMELKHLPQAAAYLELCVQHAPTHVNAWGMLITVAMEQQQYARAEEHARRVLTFRPLDYLFHHRLGVAVHHLKRLDEAADAYRQSLHLNPDFHPARANLGAAYQSQGKMEEAVECYDAVLPHLAHDAGVRNNYGALLGAMGKKQQEVHMLKEALAIDPGHVHAITNLVAIYEADGQLEEAHHYLQMAIRVIAATPSKTHPATILPLLALRDALMISPVCASYDQVFLERVRFYLNLKAWVETVHEEIRQNGSSSVTIGSLEPMDQSHFYVQFHGINDAPVQALKAEAYRLILGAPVLPTIYVDHSHPLHRMLTTLSDPIPETATSVSPSSSLLPKVRIGFMSKFFGIFEPHGMLLDGIITHLPRHQFQIYCLPIARTDMKPLTPLFRKICDEVVEISLNQGDALRHIQHLLLDILVFADTLSESMSHFLAHHSSKLADLQLAFWGNPITTGGGLVDFFISGDVMESPHRTRLAPQVDSYSEQVVLLEEQAIYYYRHVPPEQVLKEVNFDKLVAPIQVYSKRDFNMTDDCFVFLLPQSVFKIIPLYDYVLVQLLLATPDRVRVLVTGGRRPVWTEIYFQRIRDKLPPSQRHRLHLVDRVSSESFYNLVNISDVVLHPFPFDGSRTSADALILHKPYVTLPMEYLRGRMGYAFLRTMNISELVAVSVADYLDIALRLVEDAAFYRDVHARIQSELHLIWEDMYTPYLWTRFLQRLTGRGHERLRAKDFLRQHYEAHQSPDDGDQGQFAFGTDTWSDDDDIMGLGKGNGFDEDRSAMSFGEFLQQAHHMHWRHHPVDPREELDKHARRLSNARAFDERYRQRLQRDWQLEDGGLVLEDERHLIAHLFYESHRRALAFEVPVANLPTSAKEMAEEYEKTWATRLPDSDQHGLPWPRAFAQWLEHCSELAETNQQRLLARLCSAIDAQVQSDLMVKRRLRDRGVTVGPFRYRVVDQRAAAGGDLDYAQMALDLLFAPPALQPQTSTATVAAQSAPLKGGHQNSGADSEQLHGDRCVVRGGTLGSRASWQMQRFQQLVLQKDYAVAYRYGRSLLAAFHTDSVFRLELGLTGIQAAQYEEALAHCHAVEPMQADPVLVHTCLAVAGLYLVDGLPLAEREEFGMQMVRHALQAYAMDHDLARRANESDLPQYVLPEAIQVAFHLPQGLDVFPQRSSCLHPAPRRASTLFPSLSSISAEINVLSALKKQQRLRETLVMLNDMLQLVPRAYPHLESSEFVHYLALVVSLSMVDWAVDHVTMLEDVEGRMHDRGYWPAIEIQQLDPTLVEQGFVLRGLSSDGRLYRYEKESRLVEVLRGMHGRRDLLNFIVSALLAPSGPTHGQDAATSRLAAEVQGAFRDAAMDVMMINRMLSARALEALGRHVSPSSTFPVPMALPPTQMPTSSPTPFWRKNEVVLVTQYFHVRAGEGSEQRQRALDASLRKNLVNPHWTTVNLLSEAPLDLRAVHSFMDHQGVPRTKLQEVVIGERLTFSTAFRFANEHLRGRVVVLANADIFFDGTLEVLRHIDLSLGNKVLALLKWQQVDPETEAGQGVGLREESSKESTHPAAAAREAGDLLTLNLRSDSQDAWVFRAPIASKVVAQSDFYLGLPRCDNRLAYVLEVAGYEVLNPALNIRAIELQGSQDPQNRYHYTHRQAVPGVGKDVGITDSLDRLLPTRL